MKHVLTRAGALLGATTLATMAMGPAFAAETVAQAEANALTVSIAGEGGDSGTVRATHDGEELTKTGDTEPPVSVLQGQDLLDVGTLAQDATAGLDGRDGVSAACSGIAGDGASVAEVGDSECIEGGDNVGVSIANLDLSDTVVVNPETELGGVLGPLTGPVEDQVLAAITPALVEALAPLDQVQVGGTLGVVEARCAAEPGQADGTANIADAQLSAIAGGQTYVLANLPVNPPPNTKVVTDLDVVVNAVIAGVETNLETALDGVAGGLVGLTDQIQAQIVDTIVADVSDQLEPVEQNLLDITLNRQVRPAQGHIEVTGIDLRVLPAAAEELGAPLVSAQIANVSCGPNSQVTPVAQDGEPAPADLPEVPTVVDAGVGGPGQGGLDASGALVAGSLVAAGVAGLLGYRRLTVR